MRIRNWILVGSGVGVGVVTILGLLAWSIVREDWKESLPPPCDKMQGEEQVQQVVEEHEDIARRVRAAGKWAVLSVEAASDPRCRGKAYILIEYDTVWTRDRIKKLLGPTFFGVPYRMVNV